MTTISIDDIKEKRLQPVPGQRVAFQDQFGRVRIGTIRIREIRCGKPDCGKCPHKRYAYAQYRVADRVTEKYIGKA